MKKDVEPTISYWRDPDDGSLPDPEHDAEIFLGHWDEEICTVLVRDICETESGYAFDTHGFEIFTLLRKERDSPNHDTGDSEYFDEVSDMMPEEVLLFKHFDSKKDTPARRCGHTSIEIPRTENLQPRESIEVRALVGY